MLKRALICLCLFGLSACRTVPPPRVVQRSTIYCGQSVVSLFDNFGAPTHQHVNDWGIREYHYHIQSIQKKGVDNALYYCDFVVYTDDGIVVDWQYLGNKCPIETYESDSFFIPHEL